MKRTQMGLVIVGIIPLAVMSGYLSRLLQLGTWKGLLFGACVGALYGIFTRQLLDLRPPRVIYLHWLAKLRAWIDRRLPRDVLTIHILPDNNRHQESEYWTHPELILRAKMGGDARYVRTFEGKVHVIFGTEHLSP